MTYRARLRIELHDRPGALGRLAGAIGAEGGNVVSVDVQEIDNRRVIDELVVDLPDHLEIRDLGRRLSGLDAGRLVSAQPARPYGDTVLRALHWAEHLASLTVHERDDALAAALADLCSASGAWIARTPGEARQFEAGQHALDRGTAVAHRTDHLPVTLAPDVDGAAWLLAIPDDPDAPSRVAFLVRSAAMKFTATEIDRVSALLRLCRRFEGHIDLRHGWVSRHRAAAHAG